MLGPLILFIGFVTAGALTGGWAGAVVGGLVSLCFTGAVAAAALAWANTIGKQIHPEDAREAAPRPPGFGPLCDAVYRRVLAANGSGEFPEES